MQGRIMRDVHILYSGRVRAMLRRKPTKQNKPDDQMRGH